MKKKNGGLERQELGRNEKMEGQKMWLEGG